MSDSMHSNPAGGADEPGQLTDRALICALMDGELEGDDVARAVAQCESREWAAYHLIGDVLRRSDTIEPVSEIFAVRMSAALAREAPHKPIDSVRSKPVNLVTPVKAEEASGWRRWVTWPAFAVTAAVASVVWVAQPLFVDQPVSQVALTQSTPIQPSSEAAFSDYTEAHRQFAGPIAVQQASYPPGGRQ